MPEGRAVGAGENVHLQLVDRPPSVPVEVRSDHRLHGGLLPVHRADEDAPLGADPRLEAEERRRGVREAAPEGLLVEVVEGDGDAPGARHHRRRLQRRRVAAVLVRLHEAQDAADVVLGAEERLGSGQRRMDESRRRGGGCGSAGCVNVRHYPRRTGGISHQSVRRERS